MRAERIIHDLTGTEKGTSHCCEKGMEPHSPGLGTSLILIKSVTALVSLGREASVSLPGTLLQGGLK